MTDRRTATETGDQPRCHATGRMLPRSRRTDPHAPLLDAMRAIAQGAARGVFNDPRLAVHIDRSVLTWIMSWTGDNMTLPQYVALRAANEARKVKAMTTGEARAWCGRSLDALRLVGRT